MRLKFLSIVAAAGLVISISSVAKADSFSLDGPANFSGQGFGTLINLLTLQQNNGETGAVAPTTASNLSDLGSCGVHSGIELCGDAANTSQVVTAADLASIGITGSSNFGLLFNVSQEGGDPDAYLSPGAVDPFTVYFYGSDGSLLFSASYSGTDNPFVPIDGNGQGSSGYLFTLDGTQFDTYFDQIAFIGMSGTIGNSNDGPDDWSIVNAGEGSPVPEPGSLMLFGTGLLGMAGFIRRKMMS